MKVSLAFEDRKQWNQILAQSSTLDSSGFIRLLKDSFLEAWEWLIPPSEKKLKHSTIKIRVINEQSDGLQFIARYDYSNSFPRSGKYSFETYLTKLLESLPDDSQTFEWMKTIWVHEITHLLDSKEIISYEISFNTFLNLKELSFPEVFNNGHWILLSYLHSVRDEGIAVTIEKLFNLEFRNLLSEEDALARFREDMKAIAGIAGKLQYQSSDEQLNEYAAFITGNTQLTVYLISPWIMLNALIRSNPQSDLFSKIRESLRSGDRSQLSRGVIREFIWQARAFEFLDFIRALDCNDIIYQSTLEACSRYYDNYPTTLQFFSGLEKIKEQKDTRRFMSLMTKILGSPMKKDEIKAELDIMNFDALPELFREQIRELEVLAKEDEPAAIWGLTYLFSKRDLMDDTINYLGYLDDYHVISTALELTQ